MTRHLAGAARDAPIDPIRTLVAIGLIALATGPAQAYCVSVPDTAESAYVRNGLKHAICLEGELARSTELKNFQVEVGATLDRLRRNQLQQRFAVPAFTDPFAPAWP